MPLKIKDVSYFEECINLDVKICEKTCNFIRSPSQTKDEFENFVKNFESNLEHTANKSPFLIVVLGDFNARMQCWYQNFRNFKASQLSLSQIIKKLTHILNNAAFCINVIFTSQPNLAILSGVHP